MMVDIMLAMPFDIFTTLKILFAFILLISILVFISLRNMFFACLCAIILFITILSLIIPPVLSLVTSSAPPLPPIWQDATYTVTHPETWFNFTVVWPK